MKRKPVVFKASSSEIEKLRALAAGERTTVSGVIRRLIADVPVKTVVEKTVRIDTSAIATSRQTLGNSGLAVNP